MAVTRRAAKRRRVAEGPLIPPIELPREIVGCVFGFLDVASLVRLSGCNTALRNQVLDDDYHSSHLWKIIDFSKVPQETAARVSDNDLDVFLRKVHAHEHCQVLKLTGCTGVVGYGLEPLRGSRMMREMDLRLVNDYSVGPAELDLTFVLPLLSSMPPVARGVMPENSDDSDSLGLSLVKFRPQNSLIDNFFDQFDDDVAVWLEQFYESLREQAIERRTRCGYCRGVIADSQSFEDMWCLMALAYCERCKKYSCRSGEEPGVLDCPATNTCHICMIQCCQPCGPAMRTQCLTHKMVYVCESCNNRVCEDCNDGVVCANDDCCGYYCEACVDMCSVCETCQIDDDDVCPCFYCPKCTDAHKRECPGKAP